MEFNNTIIINELEGKARVDNAFRDLLKSQFRLTRTAFR